MSDATPATEGKALWERMGWARETWISYWTDVLKDRTEKAEEAKRLILEAGGSIPSEKKARQEVDVEHRICEHGRDAWADDCGMCNLSGTNWAAVEEAIPAPSSIERCEGSKAYQVADMVGAPLYVPVCASHAESWFTGRDHLNGGMESECIVCAHANPSATAVSEPVAEVMEIEARVDSEHRSQDTDSRIEAVLDDMAMEHFLNFKNGTISDRELVREILKAAVAGDMK